MITLQVKMCHLTQYLYLTVSAKDRIGLFEPTMGVTTENNA